MLACSECMCPCACLYVCARVRVGLKKISYPRPGYVTAIHHDYDYAFSFGGWRWSTRLHIYRYTYTREYIYTLLLLSCICSLPPVHVFWVVHFMCAGPVIFCSNFRVVFFFFLLSLLPFPFSLSFPPSEKSVTAAARSTAIATATAQTAPSFWQIISTYPLSYCQSLTTTTPSSF